MPRGGNASAEGHRTPYCLKTAPRPLHMVAQGFMDERTGLDAKLGEQAASHGPLPGTAWSVSGRGADSRGGWGYHHFRRRFSHRNCFRVPCLGFHLYGKTCFFRGWNITVTPRDIFSCPREFRLSGRVRLCAQTSVARASSIIVDLFERSEFLIDTSQKKSPRVCTCARVK